MSEPLEFRTVGQLRAALADVPDDRAIIAQVVAADHSAWNMLAAFVPLVRQGTIAALVLSHPTLLSLPREPFAAPPTGGPVSDSQVPRSLKEAVAIAREEAAHRTGTRCSMCRLGDVPVGGFHRRVHRCGDADSREGRLLALKADWEDRRDALAAALRPDAAMAYSHCADRLAGALDDTVAAAPPEDGWPTYNQLADGLREAVIMIEAARPDAWTNDISEHGVNEGDVLASRMLDRLSALLSRIPKEEP